MSSYTYNYPINTTHTLFINMHEQSILLGDLYQKICDYFAEGEAINMDDYEVESEAILIRNSGYDLSDPGEFEKYLIIKKIKNGEVL